MAMVVAKWPTVFSRAQSMTPMASLKVGAPVVTIVRNHPLRLRLTVPEREAGGVRAGQSVRLHLDGGVEATEGRVVRLSPAVDEHTRTLLVEAEVPNDDGALRPGTFTSAEIVVEPERLVSSDVDTGVLGEVLALFCLDDAGVVAEDSLQPRVRLFAKFVAVAKEQRGLGQPLGFVQTPEEIRRDDRLA